MPNLKKVCIMSEFRSLISKKYKIVAIIEKDDFKKGTNYHTKFFKTFDKIRYKKVMPKITNLFKKLNNGKLKSTIIMDLSGVPVSLKLTDYKLIDILKDLGYEVNEDLYIAGIVKKEGKEIPIFDILQTRASKVASLPRLKEAYEKTKSADIKRNISFYESIIEIGLIKDKTINIGKLAIYDNKKAKLVFSYDLRLIASQSTKVSWSSCLNLDTGSNQHFVGQGASSGEFVVYLAKPGDEYTLKSPTARITFKPYFTKNDEVYWLADTVYGTSSILQNAAQKVIDQYQTIQGDGKDYYLNKQSYQDNIPKDLKSRQLLLEYQDNINDIAVQEKIIQFLKKSPEFIKDLYIAGIKPTEAMQIAAVTSKPIAIKYIEEQSDTVQLAAIQKNSRIFSLLDNPSEVVQLAAVKKLGINIEHIDAPSEEVQLAAITKSGRAIRHIKNPSEKVQLAAVKNDGLAIYFIINPSKKVQLAVKTVNYPSEAVQLAAVKQNSDAIKFLNNPSDAVLLEVKQKSKIAAWVLKST